jgi:hypothetical protein
MLVELEIFPVRIIGIGWDGRGAGRQPISLFVENEQILDARRRLQHAVHQLAQIGRRGCGRIMGFQLMDEFGQRALRQLQTIVGMLGQGNRQVLGFFFDPAHRRLPGRQFSPYQQRKEGRAQADHEDGRIGFGDMGGKSFHGEAPGS